MKFREKLISILRIAVSLIVFGGVLYLLFRNVNLRKMWYAIATVNLFWICIFVILAISLFVVKVYRWKIVLKNIKDVSLSRLIGIMSIAQLLSNALPFRAGDVVQVLSLSKKENISKVSVLSTMGACYTLDMLSMIVVLFVISFFIKLPFDTGYFRYIYLLTGVMAVLAALYLFSSKKIGQTVAGHSRFFGEKLARFNDGLDIFMSRERLIFPLIYTVLLWVISYFQALALLKAFGIEDMTLIGILSFLTIPSLAVLVPVASGAIALSAGWGILVMLNVDKSIALTATLLSQVIGLIIIMLFAVGELIISGDISSSLEGYRKPEVNDSQESL